MWCTGSGVLLDNPDLCLLTYFDIKKMIIKEAQYYTVQTFEAIRSFTRLNSLKMTIAASIRSDHCGVIKQKHSHISPKLQNSLIHDLFKRQGL